MKFFLWHSLLAYARISYMELLYLPVIHLNIAQLYITMLSHKCPNNSLVYFFCSSTITNDTVH